MRNMIWAQVIFGMLFVFMLSCVGCDSRTISSAMDSSNESSVSSGAPSPEDPSLPNKTPTPSTTEADNCTDTREHFASRAIVEEVCRRVNAERIAAGGGSLKLDAALSEVAQAYAQEMVEKGFFSHTSPDGLGPSDRLKAAGIIYRTWGENIAYYYKTPAEVMTGWMNSSGHKANILNDNFGKIGIGYYQNYWVQDFTN